MLVFAYILKTNNIHIMSLIKYDNFLGKKERVDCPNFSELVNKSTDNFEKTGKIIKGKVVSIDEKAGIVTVDASLKSECNLKIEEFFLPNEKESLSEGQEIDLYLESLDKKEGGAILSRAKATREIAWQEIKAAYQNEQTIEGIAFSRVKGGVAVDYKGIMVFLPGSQIDVRPVRDISHIVGRKIAYNVLSIEEKSRSVIFSRKAILELERSEEKEEFLSSVSEGDILDGVVKNITNYGVFIDLGAIDGLLHVTDIAWERISHPSEVLTVGQSVKVKVIKYNQEDKRLSLGMKQLTENPWKLIKEKYAIGSVFKGQIINITSYGAFVKLENGVEGLLHVSEICWTKDSHKKHKEMTVGTEVEVSIIEVDIEKHRIALSMKQMQKNPWKEFGEKYNKGDILDGTIRNITDFGLFIGIEGFDVDGLVHISDLSWGSDGVNELKEYTKGDAIKVIYLDSDIEKHRIRFGVKQLGEDPFKDIQGKINKGDVVECNITKVREEGLEVVIFDTVKSFIKKSHLLKEKEFNVADKFSEGEKINVKVIFCDLDSGKIILSLKALEYDEQQKTADKFKSESEEDLTLGSVLGDAIELAKQESERKSSGEDSKK